MKKILFVLASVFMLFGCSMKMDGPKLVVENYLKEYKSLNEKHVSSLENKETEEKFNEENKKNYIETLKKQYTGLEYEIEDEKIDGNKATVIAKIKVTDYYKVKKDSNNYLNENIREFMHDEVYDENLYHSYLINALNSAKEKVEYSLEFNLTKKDKEWVIDNIDDDMILKIQGLYNYEE